MLTKPIRLSLTMKSEIQHSQDSKALFASPDSHHMEEIDMSISMLDNTQMRKSESTWHGRHSADFHLL